MTTFNATDKPVTIPVPPTDSATTSGGRRNRPRHDWSRSTGIAVPLGLYLVFTLVPFYWMLVYAFRKNGSKAMVPWPITFTHFKTTWNTLGFGFFLRNSAYVAIGTLVFTSILALMGGYALARFRFRGRGAFMLALLCTQFVPGAMLLIPMFEIFKALGLLNNLLGLVVADTAFQLPLSLMLMSGFIRSVPIELEEAAQIDGCSRLRAFLAVVLPLLRPALIAVGSFAFIGSWNNFLFALMFISDQNRFTVAVGLSYTIGEYNVDFGALAAGGLLAVLPVVVIFAVIQRYLVQGMSAGAVKG